MSNLIKRYSFEVSDFSGRGVVKDRHGVWVKFDDIKEFLPSTSYNKRIKQGSKRPHARRTS